MNLEPITLEPVYRGETLRITLEILDEDGELKDLTGGDLIFRMALANTLGSQEAVIDSDADADSATVVQETSGIVIVEVPEEQTELLLAMTYEWNVTATDVEGNRAMVARGYVTMRNPIPGPLT